MTIREIAEQYIRGLKMREQAQQLNQKNLAAKFERCVRAISAIANGRHVPYIPDDEQALIRECLNEAKRLRWEASKVSMPRLCHEHGVGHKAIEDELYRMGYWEETA